MWATALELLTGAWQWTPRSAENSAAQIGIAGKTDPIGDGKEHYKKSSGSAPRILNLIPVVMPRGRDQDHDVRYHKRKSKFGVGNRRRTRSPEEHVVLFLRFRIRPFFTRQRVLTSPADPDPWVPLTRDTLSR